jgi:hypothetical protein
MPRELQNSRCKMVLAISQQRSSVISHFYVVDLQSLYRNFIRTY